MPTLTPLKTVVSWPLEGPDGHPLRPRQTRWTEIEVDVPTYSAEEAPVSVSVRIQTPGPGHYNRPAIWRHVGQRLYSYGRSASIGEGPLALKRILRPSWMEPGERVGTQASEGDLDRPEAQKAIALVRTFAQDCTILVGDRVLRRSAGPFLTIGHSYVAEARITQALTGPTRPDMWTASFVFPVNEAAQGLAFAQTYYRARIAAFQGDITISGPVQDEDYDPVAFMQTCVAHNMVWRLNRLELREAGTEVLRPLAGLRAALTSAHRNIVSFPELGHWPYPDHTFEFRQDKGVHDAILGLSKVFPEAVGTKHARLLAKAYLVRTGSVDATLEADVEADDLEALSAPV